MFLLIIDKELLTVNTLPNGSVTHIAGQACLLQICFKEGLPDASQRISGTTKSSLIVLTQKTSLDCSPPPHDLLQGSQSLNVHLLKILCSKKSHNQKRL